MSTLRRDLPGETPLHDVSGLKLKGIVERAQLENAEADNIRRVVVRYFAAPITERMAPFTMAWARALHHEMIGEVWSWAGTLRTHQTNIGLPPAQVESHLHGLFQDLAEWKRTGMPLSEQAARLHHQAVFIHPFANGNGRWARMLANIWLWLHGSTPTEWLEAQLSARSEARSAYLAAIRAADQGNFAPLLTLQQRFTASPPA